MTRSHPLLGRLMSRLNRLCGQEEEPSWAAMGMLEPGTMEPGRPVEKLGGAC